MRVGIGYDIHRLVKGRSLILGGVSIAYAKGLQGHSDADVLVHAICDALLGAAGLGDIGHHFPDTDPQYKDISSLKLLSQTCLKLNEKGFAHMAATVDGRGLLKLAQSAFQVEALLFGAGNLPGRNEKSLRWDFSIRICLPNSGACFL